MQSTMKRMEKDANKLQKEIDQNRREMMKMMKEQQESRQEQEEKSNEKYNELVKQMTHTKECQEGRRIRESKDWWGCSRPNMERHSSLKECRCIEGYKYAANIQ